MNDFNFRIGDKVYYPMATNEVLEVNPNLFVEYLGADADDENDTSTASFKPNGKLYDLHHNPGIFPATKEWYDKLVHVFPNLKKPPKVKSAMEIITAMLEAGYDGVPCRTVNGIKFICTGIKYESFYPFEFSGLNGEDAYSTATPYDPRTGRRIIDFVDGLAKLEVPIPR